MVNYVWIVQKKFVNVHRCKNTLQMLQIRCRYMLQIAHTPNYFNCNKLLKSIVMNKQSIFPMSNDNETTVKQSKGVLIRLSTFAISQLKSWYNDTLSGMKSWRWIIDRCLDDSRLSIRCRNQSWALSVFFNFFNNKKWFFAFFIKLIWLGVGFLNRTGAEIGY